MLDKAFEALKTYDWGKDQDHNALQAIDLAILAAHGDSEARQELEQRLASALMFDEPEGSAPSATPAFFKSPVITKKTPNRAVEIDFDITGAKQLFLVATDGGNGNGADWVAWATPRLVSDNGERKLTELKWREASSGWGSTQVNHNADGGPLKINGKQVEYGIGAHANSEIAFDLPPGFTRFLATAGVDDGGAEQGDMASVEFAVYTQKPFVGTPAGDVARRVNDFICRKLRVIGSSNSVPALARLLLDERHSHMARFALERIPAPEAVQALRDALPGTANEQKIGVISSLGALQDAASVAPLGALLDDSDAAVARAAALALGAIRSEEAAKVLSNAKPNAESKAAVTDALLACAESLLAAGKKGEALAVYKTVAKGDQPKHVKLAATRGMLAGAGQK